MPRLALALLFLPLAGCNAVLGLDERDRAGDTGEVVDTSVIDALGDDTADTNTPVEDSNVVDANGPDTGVMVDTGITSDTASPCLYSVCLGFCTDTQSDPRHCGKCGERCNDGEYCVSGACRCRPGAVNCGAGSDCAPITASRCVTCAVGCPASGTHNCDVASRTCVSACAAGKTACAVGINYDCVDTRTDPFHCGECGKDCNFDEVCATGNCRRYMPAAGCKSCPCACPGGFLCCPGLPGHSTAICVLGDKC